MNKNATVREFAIEIGICDKIAYKMAKSDEFRMNKISFDISVKKCKEKNKRAYHNWRIDIQRYYEARNNGLL